MTTSEQIAARAAYTAQALASMGSCPVWDNALADYLRREALDFADYEFGRYAAAREASGYAADRLACKYGKAWRQDDKALLEWAPIDAAFKEAENAYFANFSDPLSVSAYALVEVPAPNLEAALWKVQMIARQELNVDPETGLACMDHAARDMARVARECIGMNQIGGRA